LPPRTAAERAAKMAALPLLRAAEDGVTYALAKNNKPDTLNVWLLLSG